MARPQSGLIRHNSKEKYGLVFGLGFLSMMLVLLPPMVLDQGYFIYYGDFISQQLPFYYHANEVIRSGGLLGWDWGTDLGSSFIGSYAFYLTGSPFFWLTVLLPQKWVLYAVPWLLGLKHGIAALTAYGYIRRFVADRNAAAAGGLLYAFSGFQMFNIFFNHFQDVTAFFPLMLIAMEDLVNRQRRGWFAASVALMACINYFFFAGQVVFLLLYFFLRLRCSDFRITWKKFAALAIEAVLGVMVACAVLLPAALAVMGNTRVSQMLYGQDMLFYQDKTRIARIIQSFFMIPDAPARPNLFDTDTGKWASIGGYLPMFSMAGVIAFMGQKKRHWATRLVWVCMICAFVPVLNSAFYMFNGAYYARWYYMPILLMAMMTASALEQRALNWRTGMLVAIAVPAVCGLIALLPVKAEDGTVQFFHFAKSYLFLYVGLAVVLVCWLAMYWLYCLRREGKPYLRLAVGLTAAACTVCTMTMVYYGKSLGADSVQYRQRAIDGREHLSVSYETDDADYFRVDISESLDNYPMFWGMSSMRCFQSVVSPSIMEFYSSIGIPRDVASRAETERYTLRGLLSVKYYFQEIKKNMEDPKLPGFVFDREENGFQIYRNAYFIPMGFAYDKYVTDAMLDGKTDTARERVLIHALLLSEQQVRQYKDIIRPAELNSMNLSEEQYLAECQARSAVSCHDLQYNAYGFSASITLDSPKLIFFSIPYDTGWTAEVNGTPVTVEKVDHGMTAIRCETGENRIVFRYRLPGLLPGICVSAAGVILLVLYLVLGRKLLNGEKPTSGYSYDNQPSGGVRAARAYVDALQREMAPAQKGEDANGTSE